MDEIFNASTMEYESSGLEELPDVLTFECDNCRNTWRQTYIEGVTDV